MNGVLGTAMCPLSHLLSAHQGPNPVPSTKDTMIKNNMSLSSQNLQPTSEPTRKDFTEISALLPIPNTSFLTK